MSKVSSLYHGISSRYHIPKNTFPTRVFSTRLTELYPDLYVIAKLSREPKHIYELPKIQEFNSNLFILPDIPIRRGDEPIIKVLLRLFGLKGLWYDYLTIQNTPQIGVKVIGFHNQAKAFFNVLGYILGYIRIDRMIKYEAYNKRLMKYRKVNRKYPGKLTKPINFKRYYSERGNKIRKISHQILNDLLERILIEMGLPYYEGIDEYIKEMGLQRKRSTKLIKNNRAIW